MPFITLKEAYDSNQRNRVKTPILISTEQFLNTSDRTLAFGRTGVITCGKIEYMHVYFLDGAIHVFTYCVYDDGDRFLGSEKFQADVAPAKRLRPQEGVAYFTADREFAALMESCGYPLRLIPMEVCGKKIELWKDTLYFGKVPTVNCKYHEDKLRIGH